MDPQHRPGSEIRAIDDFRGARDAATPADRLEEVRRRALALRDRLLDQPEVIYYRSIDLIATPYPVRYGLHDAAKVTTPWMSIVNRLVVVQYQTSAGVRTLLFSPSDIEANAATPWFHHFADIPLRALLEKMLVPFRRTVEEALAMTGISPAQVDYIAYDNLHTQDLRKWLGTKGRKGYFPNARLLVMRAEWEVAQGPLPPQAMWYCPDGTTDVSPQRVMLLDGDVQLGTGLTLLRTPGHTAGNQSLVARTPDGLLVSSGNGISADSYAPLQSEIPGVRDHAARYGLEVIMNANTLAGDDDQYLSMVQEKTIAGPAPHHPDFCNVVPVSELTPNMFFPGLKATFSFGELAYGQPVLA